MPRAMTLAQKELEAVKGKAAKAEAEHSQTVKEAAAKAAEAAQLAQLHTKTVQAREHPLNS